MSFLYRKGHGKPIRDAMKARKLSCRGLAALTREVDPTGRGISPAAVSAVSGQGQGAQTRTRLRTGWLLGEALQEPMQDLFSPFDMPTDSTEKP
jgi:hypothetical protein